ncbi:succinate dehydrogenase cytochrome b560 subunit, mitochondrial [Episyrphus balteatus]|uniref:succinate dehydrogenase cytochrome b560 subunit, mitochondrial n=1 Tax=Episyrphus balteatus TaxID=286459 RepID=UPI0024867B23|nr:succinate dehydrogenase cytochrome b560 subunit, mitochondrial [Episyrphus balteatus]
MFNITRALNQSSVLRNAGALAAARNITMKIVPPVAQPVESFDEKNSRLQRALSPHLTIYRPQLTSMLSISHRMTGLALAGYSTVLGLGALVSPVDFSHYVTMIEGLQLSAGSLIAIKFILAYPMGYHTANGVRHLIWDTGKCLKINEVYSTGYAMVGSSIVLTAILALL